MAQEEAAAAAADAGAARRLGIIHRVGAWLALATSPCAWAVFPGTPMMGGGSVGVRLFPLPSVRAPPGCDGDVEVPRGLSPRCISLANEALGVLNELDAGGDVGFANNLRNEARISVLDTVIARSTRFAASSPGLSEFEAFSEVCGSFDYRGEAVSFAPLDEAKVSLRPSGAAPVDLSVLLGDGGTKVAEEFVNSCCVPKDVGAQRVSDSGISQVFLDPGLRRSKRRCHRFVGRLHAAGMVDWTSGSVFCTVGLFTVWKKSSRQRLVIDCRHSSCFFIDPPHASLPTSVAYSRLRLQTGQKVHSAQYDLRDAFYQIALPLSLRDYFALPPVPAHVLGLRRFPSDAMVHPRLAVLPMGRAHALNVCQMIRNKIITDALGDVPFLDDHAPGPPLSNFVVSSYVGNFGVLSERPEVCREVLETVHAEVRRRGLDTHEEVLSTEGAEILGMDISPEGVVSARHLRRHHLRRAIG